MSPAAPLIAVLAAAGLCAGCDAGSAPDFATPARLGRAVDLRFQPLTWAPGDALHLQVGPLGLTSTAVAAGLHRVSWTGVAASSLRLVGLLDGSVVSESAADSTGSGGTTTAGPTSVHKRMTCEGAVCIEIVEYDYDLTAPHGDGRTDWTHPDGQITPVDRLRLVRALSAPATAERLVVTSPEPLRVVR